MDSDPQTIRPDAGLLRRLCKSREFADANFPQKILRILFSHNAGLSMDQLLFHLNYQAEADRVRKEVTTVRYKLASYFKQHPGEKIRVFIEEKRYRLRFGKYEMPFVSAGSALDLFWQPYLTPARTVFFTATDFPQFCDLQVKQHWAPRSYDVVVRGEIRVPRGERCFHLPTGLLLTVSIFSKFFAAKGVRFEYDVSTTPPPPTGSRIVIGKDPFSKEFPTWPQEGVFLIHPEDAKLDRALEEVPRRGRRFQDFVTKSPPRFHCYAMVVKSPVLGMPGIFKTEINAHHSVAVEAAAEFLIDDNQFAAVISRLSPGTLSTPDYLALLLRISCSVESPEAFELAPAIPRIYLKVLKRKLLTVTHRPVRVVGSKLEDSPEAGIELIEKANLAYERLEATEGNSVQIYDDEYCSFPDEEDGHPGNWFVRRICGLALAPAACQVSDRGPFQ